MVCSRHFNDWSSWILLMMVKNYFVSIHRLTCKSMLLHGLQRSVRNVPKVPNCFKL